MKKIYTAKSLGEKPSKWSYKGYEVIGVGAYNTLYYGGSGKIAYLDYEIVGIKQKLTSLKLAKEVINGLVEKKKTGTVNQFYGSFAFRKFAKDFFNNLTWCEKDNQYVCPVFLAQQQRAKEILAEWEAKRKEKKMR